MQQEFYGKVQDFIANLFGSSIFRNMVGKGTLACMRKFLKEIRLDEISKTDPSRYAETLDRLTEQFLQKMPVNDRRWGVARKCLNLFFRDVLYNFYLRERYDFAKFESYLEIPLDSHVGEALRSKCGGVDLPPWHTVKGLTKEESDKFQSAAAELAKSCETERVHLDVVYWRGSPD